MIVLAALAGSTPAGAPSSVAPIYLRCEGLTEPWAIQSASPRLGWELKATARRIGAVQTAYRIQVATTRERLKADRPDLWDTGRVSSDATLHVAYAGLTVRPGCRAFWRVMVWDEEGRASAWSVIASWTRGLPTPADWHGSWIGDPAVYPIAARAHNGAHSALAPASETTKWFEIDLGAPRRVDGVRLWPALPYDWQPPTPGFLYPVRFRIEVSPDPDGPFQTVVDASAADAPAPAEPQRYSFAPVHARVVRLTAVRLRSRGDGQYGMALAELEALDGESVISQGVLARALDSIETGAWSIANLTDGDRSSHPEGPDPALPAWMARREFDLRTKPRHAALFASALGVYEIRVNGNRVGDHVLAPEWTDYGRRVQYQGYDVTRLLRRGRNVVSVTVGDGWYSGRIGLFPGRGHYGRRPEFRLELRCDGSSDAAVATDGTWKVTADGPIRSSDILDGEVYDARAELEAWRRVGYDDTACPTASVHAHPDLIMDAQPNEPIRVTRELRPIALTTPAPGVWIYDLGQNMVGRVRMRLRAAAGTVVRFRHAEMLDEHGSLYTANLRGASQTDTYTCRGGSVEVFEPSFTYHGFRYVEITGLPSAPATDDLIGRVFHSGAPEVGSFECSDATINRLWQNILWTQRANLMGTPTDCPQRDERLGWMGDIQAFGPTACFNMDMAQFFTKWLQDVRDAQAADGRFPDFAPNPADSQKRFSGVPAWGDAGVIIPWLAYQTYGDRRFLETGYPSAVRWIEYILANNPDHLWRNGRHADYGDWLNGDTLIADGWPSTGGAVSKELLATAFWAHSTRLTASMARVLGRSDDALRLDALYQRIRTAFNDTFVRADGSMEGDTQAGYALALHFDLLPEALRAPALERMVRNIEEGYRSHASTGIQTTHRMMLELSRGGRHDVAYRLLMNRTFPGWLYSVDNGATTIWERWDGFVKGRGFQDPGMNSFNHWALGAVGEWIVETVLGLRQDPASIGWRGFIVDPAPGGELSSVRGTYRSPSGTIVIGWRRRPSRFELDLTVPPGAFAQVILPADDPSAILSGREPISSASGIRTVEARGGRVIVGVTSGTYRFRCPMRGR